MIRWRGTLQTQIEADLIRDLGLNKLKGCQDASVNP